MEKNTSPRPDVLPSEITDNIIAFFEELRKCGVELARADKIRGDGAMVIDLHKEMMRKLPEDPTDLHVQLEYIVMTAYQEAITK